jgi:metal-responsive CopG/Arc/MetJ family transcriptional regulator
MKTTISIPEPVFRKAENLAQSLGVSRSELYCRALRALISQLEDAVVTEKLNRVYESSDAKSGLEPGLAALQSRSIGQERCGSNAPCATTAD